MSSLGFGMAVCFFNLPSSVVHTDKMIADKRRFDGCHWIRGYSSMMSGLIRGDILGIRDMIEVRSRDVPHVSERQQHLVSAQYSCTYSNE
eukprot:scaffold1830_cov117-Cylindrotheca_fusiformis.AAC.16